MAYKRKTKDVYKLIYEGEEIDSFDSWEEAKAMAHEYSLAFHGMVTIRPRRERL